MKYSNKNIKHIYSGESPKLPDEYQEVEYLSTDGYAYIDTGIKPSTRDKHEAVFDCQLTNSTGQVLFGSVLGAWNATVNSWMLFRPHQSATINRVQLWYRLSGYTNRLFSSENHFVPGTKQQLLVEQTSDTAVRIKLNSTLDESITTRNDSIEGNQPNYFLLSYQKTDMTVPNNTTMKIYRYKLSQNGVLVRDFIPCYRRSDNKPGMYDIVNKVFYSNAHSDGEFIVGADVNYKRVKFIKDTEDKIVFKDVPLAYKKCEYLENSGTQWIETNIYPKWNYFIETVFEYNQTSITTHQRGPWRFCTKVDADQGYIGHYINSSGNLAFSSAWMNVKWTQLEPATLAVANLKYTAIYNGKQAKGIIKFGSTTLSSDISYSSGKNDSTGSVKLYSINNSPTNTMVGKIYSHVVKDENNNIIQLLVPCCRRIDNKPGMYDLINDTFLINQSETGEFGYKVVESGLVVSPVSA